MPAKQGSKNTQSSFFQRFKEPYATNPALFTTFGVLITLLLFMALLLIGASDGASAVLLIAIVPMYVLVVPFTTSSIGHIARFLALVVVSLAPLAVSFLLLPTDGSCGLGCAAVLLYAAVASGVMLVMSVVMYAYGLQYQKKHVLREFWIALIAALLMALFAGSLIFRELF